MIPADQMSKPKKGSLSCSCSIEAYEVVIAWRTEASSFDSLLTEAVKSDIFQIVKLPCFLKRILLGLRFLWMMPFS
jgi:hypothetical protein